MHVEHHSCHQPIQQKHRDDPGAEHRSRDNRQQFGPITDFSERAAEAESPQHEPDPGGEEE